MTGDTHNLDPLFLSELQALEDELHLKFHITSGRRDPEHNAIVGGVSRSAHTEQPCKAADIACLTSGDRFKIVDAAFRKGFARIGIGETFVHLDRSAVLPQAVMWHYYKKKETLK